MFSRIVSHVAILPLLAHSYEKRPHDGGLFLVAQTRSAFCSAASQNFAAVGGRHPFTEAVLHLAMTLFGLVGTEHIVLLLSR